MPVPCRVITPGGAGPAAVAEDWVALARARLGRPEFPHDQAAYDALRAAVNSGQVIVLLSAITY